MKAFHSKPIIRIRHGFTLIELLVVMALTALLLTLALKPLVDTFNLTSRAGTLIESQTAARDVMREIRQTLGNAVYVYDNVQQPINIWVNDVNGTQVPLSTRFAVVQYVLPARQTDQFPGAEEIDPTSGGRMNSDSRSQDGYALPLLPGRTIGRIFVGLNNNAVNTGTGLLDISYGNRFTNTNTVDNRYLLFRAEAAAFIRDPTTRTNPAYIPNLKLFHTLANSRGEVDKRDGAFQVYDPNFFYDNSLAGETNNGKGTEIWAVPGWKDLNRDGKVNISENWRAISAPMVFSNKADLITVERDANTNAILYDRTTGLPNVRSLVQFSPAYKENDPGTPGALNNSGNEAPNAAPPLYLTQNANWSSGQRAYRVVVYLTNDANADPFTLNPLNVVIADGTLNRQGEMYIGGGTVRPNQALPAAAALPQVGPLINPTNGVFDNLNPSFAMAVDARRGLVNFEFSSGTVLHQTAANGSEVPVPARFLAQDINATLTPNVSARYLDLRNLPAGVNNGRLSPLAASRNWYNRIRIVPGSERVVGPDQRPGPNYGYPVVYTRVSGSNDVVGTNQYKINYEDASNINNDVNDPFYNGNDPSLRKGYIQFNSSADSAGILNMPLQGEARQGPFEDPVNGFFRPNGIPRLRVVNGENQPTLPLEVTFNFQTNRVKDVVKVDYLTFEQMNLSVEMRYYDPRTGVPQSTSLTDKTNVRNLKR